MKGRYFKRGIDYLKSVINDPRFFIFADDIEKAEKLDLGIEAVYIKNMNDYQSLRLLSSCKHFIISNSSFSWWGAYLSKNNDRIVIAPVKWMNNNKVNYEDKYYDNIVRL